MAEIPKDTKRPEGEKIINREKVIGALVDLVSGDIASNRIKTKDCKTCKRNASGLCNVQYLLKTAIAGAINKEGLDNILNGNDVEYNDEVLEACDDQNNKYILPDDN